MTKIFSTKPIGDNEYTEFVHVFEYEDDEESEEFQILNHTEQLAQCGFKEEKTPAKGEVHRYIIDASDFYVVIREIIMAW